MANKKNEFKKFWYNITKSLKNVTRLKARTDFLTKCLKSQIIPPTLKTKPPKSNPNQADHPKNSNGFKNVANNASKHNLQIAALDAKRAAEKAEKDHQSVLDNLMKNFTFDQHENMKNEVAKFEKNMLKQHNTKYLAKIRHLKLKHHMNTVHEDVKNNKCDSCGKLFLCSKEYKCYSCDKSIPQNVHEDQKDYKCDSCHFRIQAF